MPLRLLIVSDTLPPDPNGIALIAVRTAEILSKSADVHLIGPGGGGQICADVAYSGVSRLPIGTPDLHIARPALRLVSAAVLSADRVVVHTPGALGLWALRCASRQGKPSTLFLHNDYRALFRHGLPRTPAARLVDWVAARLESWSTRMATRVVAPWAVPHMGYEMLRLTPPRYALDAPSATANGHITVAYHGRVSREKAVDATVRAIHSADPEHRRLTFRIIGDGSQLQSTLGLAARLGVRVEHVPWCEDPRRALGDVQIYAMASRTETFSMTALEAIGCGLPLIARRVGQVQTYVQHDVNGLLFDSDDELPGLLDSLASDAATRARLSQNARLSATDRTLWEQFAAASIDPVS